MAMIIPVTCKNLHTCSQKCVCENPSDGLGRGGVGLGWGTLKEDFKEEPGQGKQE